MLDNANGVRMGAAYNFELITAYTSDLLNELLESVRSFGACNEIETGPLVAVKAPRARRQTSRGSPGEYVRLHTAANSIEYRRYAAQTFLATWLAARRSATAQRRGEPYVRFEDGMLGFYGASNFDPLKRLCAHYYMVVEDSVVFQSVRYCDTSTGYVYRPYAKNGTAPTLHVAIELDSGLVTYFRDSSGRQLYREGASSSILPGELVTKLNWFA